MRQFDVGAVPKFNENIKTTRATSLFGVSVRGAKSGETVRAFAYPKVRKYIRADVDPELWFEDVILLAQFVPGDCEVEAVSVEADDDKNFAAAAEGRAMLIVTGDLDLLTVKDFQRIRFLTPRVFLDLLSG